MKRKYLLGVLAAANVFTAISLPVYGGMWQNSDSQWSYLNDDGTYARGQWQKINENWYHFDDQGYMQTGWYQNANNGWYFLNNNAGDQLGQMQTGWQWIDGRCYYFHQNQDDNLGLMYAGCTTPDGYSVNASGNWVDSSGNAYERKDIGFTTQISNFSQKGETDWNDENEELYSDGRFTEDDSSRVTNEKLKAVDQAVDDFYEEYIEGKIEKSDPDWRFKREIEIIRYMVANIDYAEERYRTNTMIEDDYTAYGALINNEAVCSGYASAFLRLAKKCGLECVYVSNSSHAWNIVKLDDNKWYHVDVTWEDPIGGNSYGYEKLRNSYINLESSQIRKVSSHKQWSPDDKTCNSYKYGPATVSKYLSSGIVDPSGSISYERKQQEKEAKEKASLDAALSSGDNNEFAYDSASLEQELYDFVYEKTDWNKTGTQEIKTIIEYGTQNWSSTARKLAETAEVICKNLQKQELSAGLKVQSVTTSTSTVKVSGNTYRIITFKVKISENKKTHSKEHASIKETPEEAEKEDLTEETKQEDTKQEGTKQEETKEDTRQEETKQEETKEDTRQEGIKQEETKEDTRQEGTKQEETKEDTRQEGTKQQETKQDETTAVSETELSSEA